jgi:hypothetical protein
VAILFGLVPLQKPNSRMYNFVEVSRHNLESSQTWGFCMDFLNHREGGYGFLGFDLTFYESHGKIILKIDLETLTIGMSCINFLEHLILHVSHSLVVRILASGAGGLDSNPGGVTCGIGEEGLWKPWVMHSVTELCGGNQIFLIICSQKCHFNVLKFQQIFVEI